MSALLTLGYVATIFLIFTYLIEVWGIFLKSPMKMRRIDWMAAFFGALTLIIVVNSYIDNDTTMVKIISGFVIINAPVLVVYAISLVVKPIRANTIMNWLFSTPFNTK